MRKVLIGLGVVIVLVVAAAFVVPMFIPTETYKAEIKERVLAATGREIDIKGELKFSVLPTLGLRVNDVTFANAPGASTKNMATFKQLVVKLKAIPLISGNIEIDEFQLVEPVINLEVDKAGRPNWVFAKPAPAGTPAAKAPAQKTPEKKTAAPKTSSSGGADISKLKIADLRLVKGRVSYLDRRTGQRQQIDNANLKVSLPGIASPLQVKGDLVWNKERVAVELRLENPQAFADGSGSPLRLALKSKPVNLSLVGTAKGGKAVAVGGKLDIALPSVRSLAAWTGNPIQMQGSGLGPMKLAGTLAFSQGRIALTGTTLSIDKITAKGDIAVVTAGKVPSITGKLDVPSLDLNPYLAGSAGAGSSSGAKSGGQAGSKAGAQTAARPAAGSKGWSRAPINTAALRSINADLTLSAGNIRYQKIKVDRGQLRVKLAGGRLETQLQELKLYGGSGTGVIVLDGRGKGVAISQNFTIAKVKAREFLSDAAGYSGLSGLGSGMLKVTGRGVSQYAIVQSLNGNGTFAFRDGAIKGAALIGMICAINPAQLMKGVGKDKETKFSEFNGLYTIRNGLLTVAKYEDMQLKSPLLRLSAKGNTSLPVRNLNFRIEPKIVGSCKGQGAAFAKEGVAVPLFLKGSWDNPSWGVDMAALMKMGPDILKGGVKGAAKTVKGAEKTVKGLIKGINPAAGGKPKAGETGKENPAEKLRKGLGGLLGGGKKN
ncbi:MAG TPA: AsmA family protein [Alphaproteobacteria bacterium]|nr:AsmA family protein [Alphaproteobacteria bacterium]